MKWIDVGRKIGNTKKRSAGNRNVEERKDDEGYGADGNGKKGYCEEAVKTDKGQNIGLSEEAERYLQERIPFFLGKVVEVWESWDTETLCGSNISFPAKGFKNFDTIQLTVKKNLLDKPEQPLLLVVHVPAKYDPSYRVQQYVKRGTREEILQYLSSSEGHRDIARCVAQLEESNGHEDPRDR